MDHREVTLNDKYDLVEGQAYMTGIQALVRLPLDQRRLDRAAGLNTAGFISGYRGSPLGGYDQQLRAAQTYLDDHDIKFWEGLNEDLGATAVWARNNWASMLAHKKMACLASGMAKLLASIEQAMFSNMQISQVHQRLAVCSQSSATTICANLQPFLRNQNMRWLMPKFPC